VRLGCAHSVRVQLSGVTKLFGTNAHTTPGVRGISLEMCTGELTLLLGPSGSGKTTLLTLIAGLIQPTEGSVTLFGRQVDRYSAAGLQQLRARRIGFVFQAFHLIESLTVAENIALVLKFAARPHSQSSVRVKNLLQQFDLHHLAHRFPLSLSQGEKQRVAFIRAIANEPDLILADEPTASLESKQGFEIIRLLHSYVKDQQKCVIVASHDLRLVEFADRVWRIEDGKLRNSTFAEYHRTPS
jgi:putative ABC transport system ATP-binding protein